MELGSIFLVLAVLMIIGMYLYAPFIERTNYVDIREDHEISGLKAERDRVINTLQELDFDFKLGKIPAEEYPEQRNLLLQKGAEVLRQLDILSSTAPLSPNTEEARIEKAVASKTNSPIKNDDEIEAQIAQHRKQMIGKSSGFCPKCGKPVLVTDRFCPSCGKSLP
jgi:rubrerythrin